MGWGDDFLKGVTDQVTSTAQAAAASATQSAAQFVERNVSSGLVSIGAAPLGNVTAAEIEAGHTGATPSAQKIVKVAAISMPLIIGLGVAAYFLLERKAK